MVYRFDTKFVKNDNWPASAAYTQFFFGTFRKNFFRSDLTSRGNPSLIDTIAPGEGAQLRVHPAGTAAV